MIVGLARFHFGIQSRVESPPFYVSPRDSGSQQTSLATITDHHQLSPQRLLKTTNIITRSVISFPDLNEIPKPHSVSAPAPPLS